MDMQAHPKHGDHQGHDHDHGHHDHSHHHHAHDPAHGPAQGHAAGDAGPPASPPPDSPAGTIYTCPMHPEVRQDHPGNCPKCGMTLEPVLPTLDEDENPELADFRAASGGRCR
jgi:Cu+-exporting ATPase